MKESCSVERAADPAQLRGKELEDWYRRSPDEIAEERDLRELAEYQSFFGAVGEEVQTGAWQEARTARPGRTDAPKPVRPSPIRDRAELAPPVDGAPRAPGSPGSFFAESSTLGGDYFNPSWPAPLNRVQPVGRDRYLVQDPTNWSGSRIVAADEVERIFAEQKRLIAGKDEGEPAARVLAVDRVRDGSIPKPGELAKGEREMDATCHPFGGWELDPQFPTYSDRAKNYEEQITRTRGLDYVVRKPGEAAVKFDGCAVWDPRRQLLEAKGPRRADVLRASKRYGFPTKMLPSDAGQAHRQVEAANGRPVDWHAAEREYRDALSDVIYDWRSPPPPSFRLHHTPER